MKILRNLTCGAVLAAAAWAGAASADAVHDWNDIANAAVAAGRPGPIGVQDLALVQLAVHDTAQSFEQRFEPYYTKVDEVKGSKAAAVAAAAHGVLVGFYPAQAATLDATYTTWLADNALTGNPGIEVGEAIAASYIELRRLDPDPPQAPYTGVDEIGQWRATESFLAGPPATLSPMHAPWMADFDPLAITGPGRFRAPPPPELTSETYTKDYNEVKEKGALTGSIRTAEQTDVAYFWTDNFLAQWNRAIRGVAEKRVKTMGDRARLLALANMAMADAAISAWDSKLFYNYWRPLNAIREGEFDDNPDTLGDPDWQPLVNNPPYPDYTSGANNLTGATTKMLELYFGRDDIPMTVTSNAAAAVVKSRTFKSFSDASAQVLNARILLGIHFRTADAEARKQGRAVAQYVFSHYLLPL